MLENFLNKRWKVKINELKYIGFLLDVTFLKVFTTLEFLYMSIYVFFSHFFTLFTMEKSKELTCISNLQKYHFLDAKR